MAKVPGRRDDPGSQALKHLDAPSTRRISPFPRSNDPSGLVAELSRTRSPLRRPNFSASTRFNRTAFSGQSSVNHWSGRHGATLPTEDRFEGDQAEWVFLFLFNRLAIREPGPFQGRQAVEMVGLTWNCGPWLHFRRTVEKFPSRGEPACRLCIFCPSLRNVLRG